MKEPVDSITKNRYATFQASPGGKSGSGKVSVEFAHESLVVLNRILDRANTAANSFKDTNNYPAAVTIMKGVIEKVQQIIDHKEPTLGQGPTI